LPPATTNRLKDLVV